MTAARVETRWNYNGFPTVVLSNTQIRLVVVPRVGGKILNMEYRPTAHEWLWQNARIALESVSIGDTFDDHWCGGADVFFPTCYPCFWNGVNIPDAGEMWSIPWNSEVFEDESGVSLVMTAGGRIFPFESKRVIRLGHDGRSVVMNVTIRNEGHTPMPFVFGFHPALAVHERQRIWLPPGSVEVLESSGEAMGEAGQTYTWPNLRVHGRERDMSRVSPKGLGAYGGHMFVPDDGEVWWAVTDEADGAGLKLIAQKHVFKNIWMWQVYGGWKGYYHVALEPWTSYPLTLSEAVAKDRADWIAPGKTWEAEIRFVFFNHASEMNDEKVRAIKYNPGDMEVFPNE